MWKTDETTEDEAKPEDSIVITAKGTAANTPQHRQATGYERLRELLIARRNDRAMRVDRDILEDCLIEMASAVCAVERMQIMDRQCAEHELRTANEALTIQLATVTGQAGKFFTALRTIGRGMHTDEVVDLVNATIGPETEAPE